MDQPSTPTSPTASSGDLRIPHRDPAAVKLATSVKRRVTSLPRSPGEVRDRAVRAVDKRILDVPSRRDAVISGTVALSRVPGAGAVAAGTAAWMGDRLTRRKAPTAAYRLYAGVGPRVAGTPGLPLRVRKAVADLNAGVRPDDTDELVRLSVEAADRAYEARRHDAAAAHLQAAFDLLFHRYFHFEGLASPYAKDPVGYLAPLRESSAFRALTTPSDRVRTPAAPDPSRPHRLLVTTVSNFNFAKGIIDEWSQRDDVEVRTLDLRTVPKGPWEATPERLVANRLRQADGIPFEVPAEVREDFDWADTVFTEWGHRAMVWTSMLPDLQARTVSRIHSYEAFTQFPHMTDWSGIDDLVFVAEHIRNLTQVGVPAVDRGPRLHVVPNRNVLDDYTRPKRGSWERTMALVGWAQMVKDPLWALDVLDILRRHDDRWELRLFGAEFAPDEQLTTVARDYRDRVTARIAELGPAVRKMGYSKDVGHALRRVGVILSSSVREGTHEAVIQGAASGALPVVRNWPFVAAYGGPRTMFPDIWVVETPQQAADRIIAHTDDVSLADSARESAAWTREHYDWPVIEPRLEQLLLRPEGTPTA
ncbi:hypothetical protein BCF74_12146 [Knoellia remsis]|uniref:Glycosyltransferase involved in cell wall biosynthesis n=1 Tax=Knoellia remsis TaxID=407159 RepID=A0A2T0UD69_9MICO|nr:glycosyltransferase family 1 protein [Knoellia remsis]PRY55869.1 hypothetical protein BCF74_12146 [Knoellia remsis]